MDGVEHRPAFEILPSRQQRRAKQPPDEPGDRRLAQGRRATDLAGRVDAARSRERSETTEEQAFVGFEEVQAPLEGGLQGLMTLRRGPPPVCKQREPV
jgi:hypothetical protein